MVLGHLYNRTSIMWTYTESPDEKYPKKLFIFRELSYTYPVYVIGNENSENFFRARLTRMRQLVIFGELSNDFDTTGARLMRVVPSRVAIPYG
jgi:hypothetical protein